MKIKKQSQRLSFSLNFPTLFKTNKDQIFKSKTLLKTSVKTLEKMEILLLKILVEKLTEMGYL